MKNGKKLVLGFCAALPTPVLIFVATANDRYLANQSDFGLDTSLLVPYLMIAAATCLLGSCLFLGAAARPVQLMLWAYYLLGPTYLAYRILRKLYWRLFQTTLEGVPDGIVTSLLMAFFLGAVICLYRKKYNAAAMAGVLGSLGVILTINEAYQFQSRAVSVDTAVTLPERFPGAMANAFVRPESLKPVSLEKDLPNIYHLILDGFQTEMFEFLFSQEERNKELPGFQFFPENIAVYGRTRFSVPSTFLGVPFDNNSSQVDYVNAHYDSPQSFLHPLVEAGYVTCGFHCLAKNDGAPEKLFAHAVRHNEIVVVEQSDNAATFRRLWLVSCFPQIVYSQFTTEAEAQDLKANKITPSAMTLKSWLSFQKYLDLESDLSSRHRYTFMHLMIPHPPYILGCDCSVAVNEEGATSEEQAYVDHIMCAKTIILRLVNTLKELGRYDSSMIVIHGDHGFYADIRDGKLIDLSQGSDAEPEYANQHAEQFARARSRAVLLIKPPSQHNVSGPFQQHSAESSLLDIAPTILEAVGIAGQAEFAGFSLLHPESVPAGHDRFYHFYDFRTVAGQRFLAEEMYRWKIVGREINADDVISLHSTLPN